MIRKISLKILLIISVGTVLYSCTNKKAEDLQSLLDKKEARTSAMLIGETGFESVKLDDLIAHDYTKALSVIEKEEAEFNTIIEDIQKANTDGIPKGKEVQQAAISYYIALKDLFMFSRKEIEQEKIMRNSKTEKEIRAAQDQMLELGREKQKLYQKVFKADEKLFTVKRQFESENQLK
ncbi:hypothetical protein B0A69_13660 [Chryseobacterium shigense]|uniref:Lipoprotein n=1 Tax=Chryseobacterium shigense TaxID=297244 RepID=A0A1N7HUJ0_9FLAO|nr:hypothetical protein [Chryseobacterium shigense]PQA93188.1 hypothetical protein B0A69_13660 [Chryseobacterium shigense]SIS28503.1 hypothetical protein SAMN05421639_101190 [Chryseobacterium shigense]